MASTTPPNQPTNQTLKDDRFYTEIILTTIASLVASSLWVELAKNIINRNFGNNPYALLIVAATITICAIIGLGYLSRLWKVSSSNPPITPPEGYSLPYR